MDRTRRRFVHGLAAGGVAAVLDTALGTWRTPALASVGPQVGGAAVLSGTDFDLRIGEVPVNFTGRARTGIVINDSLPAPLLRWCEGDTVTLRVSNTLDETTSIHWHGIILPANMDGVPGLSFAGIAPGETFTYRFRVQQGGTYWYHSHSGFQEQLGLYGPLVIEPREPDPVACDRDYVVMLSDWTDENPHRVLARLKKQSDYYNFHERTFVDLVRDARRDGLRATLAERAAWGRMRMSAADLADVSGHTYTYLINGSTPAGNWTGLFRRGERVRLRFINAAAMTYFDVRIPGLTMTVVAADGQNVRPVTVEEFRIGNAETYDVIVTPESEQAYTIFAQSMDRTGYARGTLAPRAGMSAPVPEPDPRVFLTMADMGHDHGAHGVPAGAGHDRQAGGSGSADLPGHDEHAGHAGHSGHADHSQHSGVPGSVLPPVITHAPAEYGPGVDMRVDMPSIDLDDPGIGLRDNGRRVLTPADLRSAFPDPDGREPGRTIELHLTGHMGRYIWSFDGKKFSEAEPLRFDYGERLRLLLVNDTMMEHPIHIHGMWSDLEDGEGRFLVRKHTISVPPGQARSFRMTADAPGRWALHCHLLMHMETGMFRTIIVDEAGHHDEAAHHGHGGHP